MRSRAKRNVNGREENRLLGSPCDPSEVLRRLRFFLESFQAERYRESGIPDAFVQDNHSRSRQGVLRELHFQVKQPQAQIAIVIRGRIFDAAVDLRADSATFGRWYGVELSDEGPRQLYMAPGFAHGFCVLSEFADCTTR